MNIIKSIAFVCLLSSSSVAFTSTLTPYLRVIGESDSNISGGISSGSTSTLFIDSGATWKIAPKNDFVFRYLQVMGGNPNNYIGDIQGVSNVTLGSNISRIYQLSYKHTAKWGNIRIGIMDYNFYFDTIGAVGDLFNPTAGLNPIWATNFPSSPVFPLSSMGSIVTFGTHSTDQLRIGIASADGYLNGPFHNPVNKGTMALAEVNFRGTVDQKVNGRYTVKVGFLHNQQYRKYYTTLGPTTNGGYGIVEYKWKPLLSSVKWGTYFTVGITPRSKYNTIPLYFGGGISAEHIFPRTDMAFGISRAYIQYYNWETNYEVTINYHVNTHIEIQPDVQYITNPGGTNQLPSALVGILRIQYKL
jgi:porin